MKFPFACERVWKFLYFFPSLVGIKAPQFQFNIEASLLLTPIIAPLNMYLY